MVNVNLRKKDKDLFFFFFTSILFFVAYKKNAFFLFT